MTLTPPTHTFARTAIRPETRTIPCTACGQRFYVVHGGINGTDPAVGVPVDQAQCTEAR